MSRANSRRLLAQSPSSILSDLIPIYGRPTRCLRSFSSTPRRRADEDGFKPVSIHSLSSSASKVRSASPQPTPASTSLHAKAAPSTMGPLASFLDNSVFKANAAARRQKDQQHILDTRIPSDGSDFGSVEPSENGLETAWQLHIFATRHNVHITLVRPPGWIHPQTGRRYPKAPHNNRTIAMSLAAGNLGFRKSGRKHYDSAFQLASYVMGRMQESGMNAWIGQLEVYLRGFGAGREAVTKALLGTEGRYLRGKVTKVSDATRLKFGGTRSKKPRRLG